MHLTQRYPAAIPLSLTFAFSLAGLGVTNGGGGPSFIPTTILLSTILIHTKSHEIQTYLSQLSILTLSITLSHSKASLSALSSPAMSIFMLSLLSSVSALLAITPVYLTNTAFTVSSKLQNYRTLVFPTLWSLTWLLIARASPIGRLLTWTPLSGISSYQWVLPIVGLPGLDFISALWASTAAEFISDLLDDGPTLKDEVLLPDVSSGTEHGPVAKTKSFHDKHLISSITLLLALTIPSFTTNTLPPPPHSDVANYTPLDVACILPPPLPLSSTDSPLDQFIRETKSYRSLSKVALWPEGAVTFESETAKEQALTRIHEEVFNDGKFGQFWIGISFLLRLNGDQSTGKRDGMYRNGLTLVGPNGAEFTYYKRNLVPIAESFNQIPSSIPPPLHAIELKKPKRPVTLTASICLDFSSPISELNHVDSQTSARPSLILAPARTWDARVGETMYSLARLRAEEIGAELLWCDGGAGGLSGVGGDVQVGWGSWAKVIGVPNEDNDTKPKTTLYASFGDFGVLVFILGVWGAAGVVSINGFLLGQVDRLGIVGRDVHVRQIGDWIGRNLAGLRDRIRGRVDGNRAAPLLIQIDDEEEERLI